ncbi:MAG: hypothetical protein HY334_06790 [Armatimonadetes bacterium]|nr:hypothetical protein [Armatimonadota bacterium]
MPTKVLIRWGGAAFVIAGVFWGITSLTHPSNYDPGALFNRFWTPALAGQGLAYLFCVLGLVGLFLRQGDQAGGVGLIGFVLSSPAALPRRGSRWYNTCVSRPR